MQPALSYACRAYAVQATVHSRMHLSINTAPYAYHCMLLQARKIFAVQQTVYKSKAFINIDCFAVPLSLQARITDCFAVQHVMFAAVVYKQGRSTGFRVFSIER